MPKNVPFNELFNYDDPAGHGLGKLGWCEAALPADARKRIWNDIK